MKPKTPEQYYDLIEQALTEIDELRMAAEYDDNDELGGVSSFLDQLDREVTAMRDGMRDGTYEFKDEDLPFMNLVNNTSDRLLPFKVLLRTINHTHRNGLDV